MQAEGLGHQGRADAAMAPHRSHIAHSTQQAIGDAGGAATAAGNFQGGPTIQLDLQQASGPLHNLLKFIEPVKLKPLNQAEAIPQRRTQRSSPGGGANKGERWQIQAAGAGRRALTHGEIEAVILHRWIKNFLGHSVETMNLVDEQQLMGLQVHQQSNDVAGAL